MPWNLLITLLNQSLQRNPPGSRTAGIKAVEVALKGNNGKGVSANSVGGWLAHREAGGSRQGSVNGVSPFFEHVQTGLGRIGIGCGHHTAPAVGRETF